jgi:pyrroline-5-carboxylate reductase
MEAVLPEDIGVVRAMPNTPAIVGRAVTGIAAGERATEWAIETTVQLFETVGKTIVLEESRIDALSTISGSGPAYVFYLIEQLTLAAKHHGFNDQDAALLVNETFLGASELLAASDKTPEALRKQVTSPNGTTERAIARMAETDLQAMFVEATDAALARARELAAGK